MGVKVITPAANVLTLVQMRLHIRLIGDPHPEDALLLSSLAAAVQYAEHYTGRSIGVQTLELALDAFPTGAIDLPQGPVITITSIKYLNAAGIEQTLSPSVYTLDDYALQNRAVGFADWPDTGEFTNAVKVRYQAGSILPTVQAALLLAVAEMYENRESVSLSKGVCALLDTVTVYS